MTRRHGLPWSPGLAVGAALAILVSAACGYGVSRLGSQVLTTAPHWILIGLLGAAATASLVRSARNQELLAPSGVVAATMLVYFVVRPLGLSVSADQLLHTSYNYYATPLQTVLDLRAQELTLFVDTRMLGSLDGALTRAMVVLVLFYGFFLAGYRLPAGRVLADRCAQVGRGMRELDMRWVICVWLAVGLLGEAIVLVKIGGVAAAVGQIGSQANLAVDFLYLVVLNFYTAGLVLWTCWHPPARARERLGLGFATGQLVVFYGLLGSRTLVLVPLLLLLLALNEMRSPWRLRTLALGALLAVLFAAAYLAVREDATKRSFAQVLPAIPKYAIDMRAIFNASPVFDQLLEETNYVPSRSAHRYGGEFVQGLAGQVPRFLYPNKPQANDVSFRELIWGARFGAGRPVGAAGEFYRDFGLVGVVVGALLLGIIGRGLTGLRTRAGPPDGRRLRAALFVFGILLLYQFLVGSYSLVLGSALEIGIPLLLAVAVFARPARPAG